MKAIYFFFSFVLMLNITACTNSDSDASMLDGSSLFDSVKSTYGVEAVALPVEGVSGIPSVSVNEMQCVLEALRKYANVNTNCSVEESTEKYFGTKDEQARKVTMGNTYRATTSTGSLLEEFVLKVQLKFSTEGGQVYYFGTDYTYDSNLFNWRANGLSLTPAKNAEKYTYEFESESFLYFKVKDQGNCVVKVPVVFKGNYNLKSEKGTYSFQLLKCM